MSATEKRPIAAIRIGDRHRKDLGDLGPLAASIEAEGLLQPIGITPDDELVFGERRLAACRDLLGRKEIDVRVVAVSAIAAGEYAENEIRKDFTTSERVAILETIKRFKHGGDRKSDQRPDLDVAANAAKSVGFSSRAVAYQALAVVKRGAPELVAAMDRGDIAIEPAATIAKLPVEEQRKVIALDRKERESKVAELRFAQRRKLRGRKVHRKITIPYNAAAAARLLLERWPPDFCRELAEALQRGLSDKTEEAA